MNQAPLYIMYLEIEAAFELKSRFINLLLTFHGLENDDPHKYLKAFHLTYSLMKPQEVTEKQIKLEAFQFSKVDVAKEWLFYLPQSLITTYDQMVYVFWIDSFLHLEPQC